MDSVTLIVIGICVLLLLLCLTVIALLYVSGILSPIDVGAGTPPIGKATIAYKFARGPYKNSGNLFNEVTKYAPDFKCLGIYYDDPKVIPQEKLRYAVGAVLSEGDVKVKKELLDQLTEAGFKFMTLPEVTNCVKTTFPFINTLSIIIAVWRVYPKLSSYIQEHKLCAYPFLEIYEGSLMYFMAPLAKQDEFFVPESKEDIPSEYEDDSFIDPSDGSPSYYEGSPSSSASRSVSRFSHGSYLMSDNQDDSDLDESIRQGSPNIQDEEVSSSVDVRASKARTNLLEDDTEPADVNKESMSDPLVNASKEKDNDSVNVLQDSGICSGRTSAVPSEVNASFEQGQRVETDENDSASSFEEVHME